MELNCNMRGVIGSRGLRLFIIQYGWLSDEARGEREREKVSRRGVGGDTEHYVVHPHVGNVIFFFFPFFFCHFMSSYYSGY